MKREKSPKRVVSGIILINKACNSILLVHQRDSGYWGVPKGGVNGDENRLLAALREMNEETGIKLTHQNSILIGRMGTIVYIFQWTHEKDPVIVIGDVDEIIEAKWVSIDQLFKFPMNYFSSTHLRALCRSCRVPRKPIKKLVGGCCDVRKFDDKKKNHIIKTTSST